MKDIMKDKIIYAYIQADKDWNLIEPISEDDGSTVVDIALLPIIGWEIQTYPPTKEGIHPLTFVYPVTIDGVFRDDVIIQYTNGEASAPNGRCFKNKSEIIAYYNE